MSFDSQANPMKPVRSRPTRWISPTSMRYPRIHKLGVVQNKVPLDWAGHRQRTDLACAPASTITRPGASQDMAFKAIRNGCSEGAAKST